MTNKDLKNLIISQTGMDSKDYDKIMDYFNDKGIKINLPDKIAMFDTAAFIKSNVEPVANENVEITKYDKALAEEIGVKGESIARFTAYAENISDTLESYRNNIFVGGMVEDAIKNANLDKFMGSQSEIGKNLCDQFGVSLEKKEITVEHETDKPGNSATVKPNKTNLIDVGNGIYLRDAELGYTIIVNSGDKMEVLGNIALADSYKKEFVSELKEKAGEFEGSNFGIIDKMKLISCTKEIREEIKDENDFTNAVQDAVIFGLELKESRLVESIEKIDANIDKLNDGPIKNLLTKTRDALNEQLDETQAQLDKLEAAQIDKAKDLKEEYAVIRDNLQKSLDEIEANIDDAKGLVRSVLEMQRDALVDKIDEANDRINACEAKINGASTEEQREVEKAAAEKNLTEVASRIVAGANQAAEKVTDVVQDAANGVKSGAATFVVNFDNAVADLKDFWNKVENVFEENKDKVTAFVAGKVDEVAKNEHVQGVANAGKEFGNDTKDDFKEIGKEAVDLYNDIKGSKSIKDVGNALGEFYNDVQDNIKEIGKEAKEFGKEVVAVGAAAAEDIKEAAKDAGKWVVDKAADLKEDIENKWDNFKDGIADFFDRD